MSNDSVPPEPNTRHADVISEYISGSTFDIERFRSLPLPNEQQLLASWGEKRPPLVSILCITYNHREFVEDAIRGFLIQITDFPFEIIIHDDASSDGTSAILSEWRSRYPNIIKLVQQQVNLYSRGASPSAIALKHASGDFICICEGDDFWLDEHKLQHQAKSLSADSGFAVSYHNAIVIDADWNVISASQLRDEHKIDRPAGDLLMARVWILNLTRMIRRSALHYPPEVFKTSNRDRFLISVIGNHGGAKYERDLQPAVYRVHSGGIWSQLDAKTKTDERINTSFWLHRFYKRTGNKRVAREFEITFLKYVTRKYSLTQIILARLLRINVLGKLHSHFRSKGDK